MQKSNRSTRLLKILFGRVSFIVIGILVQLLYLGLLFWTLGTIFSYSYIVFLAVGFVVALFIINGRSNPSYKLIWTFVVLSFPIFGCMIYWFYGDRKKKSYSLLPQRYSAPLAEYNSCKFSDNISRTVKYLKNICGFPAYGGCKAEYYPNGESSFSDILSQLESAEKYIFVQFFIIEAGVMWDSILEILERKAKSGIDVRVIYDDMGCLLTLPRDYCGTLESKGIKCCCFGRIKPIWSSKVNNRDHRKILIVDGKCAFTGGINLADEYINLYEKHGYWKDSVLKLSGNAVNSFIMMFLSAWDYLRNEESDPERFIVSTEIKGGTAAVPFMSSPLFYESAAENVYIGLISAARRYIYITTPYLILDNEMKYQLILAAKSGVDVRIITPHVPDKKIVFEVTRANYPELIRNGVRIYEYLPGFIHAKNMIIDDEFSVVGTINLDFRSLYLHYECAVLCEDKALANAVLTDFKATLSKSQEITVQDCENISIFKKVLRGLLKFFSPMM